MAVERFEVLASRPYEDGRPFGTAGPYERLDGVIHYAIDPGEAANGEIADLSLAPRDADGLVRFHGDAVVLRPSTMAGSARRLLLFVPNRGRMALVPFSLPTALPAAEITDRIEPGDGFLLNRGWTVLFCGWQWDVDRRPGLLGLEAPMAVADGDVALPGRAQVRFQPNDDRPDEMLSHWPLHPRAQVRAVSHRPLPAADPGDPEAELFEREHAAAPPRKVDRERWRFARDRDGSPVADPSFVWLQGGFRKGRVYEVVYRPAIAPVAGSGLLAVRDAGAFLRYDAPDFGPIEHAFAYGVSQCGRFLRDFLYWGLNADESGRSVFDGVIPHVAGARRGEFNHRFAQPSVQHAPGLGHLPPFHDDDLRDGDTEVAGLLARQRARGGVPKVFTINTSSEYWRTEASLVHTDVAGSRDVEPPPEVRVYLLAGTQHSSGFPMLLRELAIYPGTKTVNPMTTVNYAPLMRAALVALEAWVAGGIDPPRSAVPRLGDGTAARRDDVLAAFRALPGTGLLDPSRLPTLRRLDLGADGGLGLPTFPARLGEAYACHVSAVDDDLNEVAGIRLPDLTVPLGTHTGWNPRDPAAGAEGELVDMLGSTIPFPATAAERARTGDPRRSIEERYASRDEYAALVAKAAQELVADRFLLDEDVEVVVRSCLRLYDALTKVAAT